MYCKVCLIFVGLAGGELELEIAVTVLFSVCVCAVASVHLSVLANLACWGLYFIMGDRF